MKQKTTHMDKIWKKRFIIFWHAGSNSGHLNYSTRFSNTEFLVELGSHTFQNIIIAQGSCENHEIPQPSALAFTWIGRLEQKVDESRFSFSILNCNLSGGKHSAAPWTFPLGKHTKPSFIKNKDVSAGHCSISGYATIGLEEPQMLPDKKP